MKPLNNPSQETLDYLKHSCKKQRRINRLRSRQYRFFYSSPIINVLGTIGFSIIVGNTILGTEGMGALVVGFFLLPTIPLFLGFSGVFVYGFRYPITVEESLRLNGLTWVICLCISLSVTGFFNNPLGLLNYALAPNRLGVLSLVLVPIGSLIAYLVHKYLLGTQKASVKIKKRILPSQPNDDI
ncbi:MAG: hypothetical protein H2174_09365 [Vampirovibrio sp.]|nr:hypothetical protein [Vampirovibrio sp.]